MPLKKVSNQKFDTFEEAFKASYTDLDAWFDCVTAAVRRMVPGIFENVDLNEAHKQLLQTAEARDGELTVEVFEGTKKGE